MMAIFARPEEEVETCKAKIAEDTGLRYCVTRYSKLISSDYVFKIKDFTHKKIPILPAVPQNLHSLLQLEDSSLPYNRLPSIHKVMTKLCKKDILATVAMRQDIQSIDEFAVHIIERAQDLKINEKEKSVKKFAFTELVKTLQSMGISSRIAAITQEQKEISHLFSLPEITVPQELVHPLSLNLFVKSDGYYFKLIGKILKMRNAAHNFSKDLSKREVEKTTGYAEQLLFLVAKQRALVSQTVQHVTVLKNYVTVVGELENSEELVPQQEKAKKWYLKVKVNSWGYFWGIYE
jgi:midasin (ATPase involved in ribosome maturation)